MNKRTTPSREDLIPLANIEAEAAFLGGCLVDNRIVEECASLLAPGDFYAQLHEKIWSKCLELVADGRSATPVTLKPFFVNDDLMLQAARQEFPGDVFVSASAYLAKLTGNLAVVIGARDFAVQIKDLARLRRIRESLEIALTDCENTAEDLDPDGVLSRLETKLASDGVTIERIKTRSYASAIDALTASWDAVEAGGELPGFFIEGYNDWNAIVGRMSDGDLTYVGARPSMGKTALAIKVAQGAARAGIPTEFFSLEQDDLAITRRAIADRIYEEGYTSPYTKLTEGKLSAYDKEAIARVRAEIAAEPFYLSAPDHMNVEDLAPQLRKRKRALERQGRKLQLVVIDYLDRFGTLKEFRASENQARVSYISRTIKAVAKQLGVAIVCLVQLSRGLEERTDKHPVLRDLRDSGALEQDGDNIVFLYRDEYYLRQEEPKHKDTKKWEEWDLEMKSARDKLEIYSAKRREGKPTKRTSYFLLEHMAIRSHDYRQDGLFF